jgi:glutaredoxin-related protein
MMDLVLCIIVISIILLAFAQGQSYLRDRYVKRYFKESGLRFILVCHDTDMKNKCENEIDRNKYDQIEILSIGSMKSVDDFIKLKMLESTVRKSGVMKYPCLLTIQDNRINGRIFKG